MRNECEEASVQRLSVWLLQRGRQAKQPTTGKRKKDCEADDSQVEPGLVKIGNACGGNGNEKTQQAFCQDAPSDRSSKGQQKRFRQRLTSQPGSTCTQSGTN